MSDESTRSKEVAHITAQAGQNARKRGLKERAADEAKRMFAIFLYLFVLFGLFNIHEYVVLTQHQIEFTNYGFAVVNAAIFAKVMLVAEDLRLGKRFEDRPLIYPVFFKAFIFMIVFICFRVVEEVLVGLWKGKTITESMPEFGGGGLKGIASVGVIAAFALVPYFAYREMARIIGKDELRSLILTRRTKVDRHQAATKL